MIKKITNILLFIVLLAISTAPVFAKPVKLEYRFKTGQADKYRVVVKSEQSMPDTASASSTKDTVNILMAQKVTKVNKDGSASVILNIKGIGADITRIPPINRQVLISKTGEYLVAKASLQGSVSAPPPGNSEGTAIVLPKKRVSAGDTWSTAVTLPGSTGTLKAIATYKGATSTPKGRRVYKIIQTYSGIVDMSKILATDKTTAPGSTAKAQIVGSGTYLLDRRDCRLVSVTGNITSITTILTPKTKTTPATTTRLKSLMDTVVTRM